jgi:2-oxo-4-hydroxy-4-carboxy-5-ureidoimidazoline decarboxylase
MSAMSLDELNVCEPPQFVAVLAAIYEHSPWVAEAVAARRPFASLADLHESMSAVVREASDMSKRALLKAHPDLAGKAARAGELTADSKSEQHSAGLDRLSDQEFNELHRLNKAYHDKFGFPFIICVRRHGKDSIFRQFDMRLRNDIATEFDTALIEVFRIAALRLDQHIRGPDKLPVHGRLSTHVLDTHLGKPAHGVALKLYALSSSGSDLVTGGTTNADGRTDAPLIAGRPLPIGRYELRFAVADYFRARGVMLAEPPFLDIVPLQFSLAEPEGHYHVPLIVTPWSYATYRGS